MMKGEAKNVKDIYEVDWNSKLACFKHMHYTLKSKQRGLV